MGDVFIRGARVIDGSGSAAYVGDLSVANGRIRAIGTHLVPSAELVVNAEGRYLAPGFVDAHCHDDLICIREPQREEKVTQGVTTVVVGNCSFSLYPVIPTSAEALRKHFSGLLGETLPTEVFADLNAYGAGLGEMAVNVASLTGHAALRYAVVGPERRSATESEIAEMQSLLETQLSQGSVGLSLGLVYPPSAYAGQDELIGLAKIVHRHGKVLAAHIRSYEGELMEAICEFINVLKASGAKGLLSHLQCAGRPNCGSASAALQLLEAARKEGVDVEFDMYPYTAGSSYLLQLLPLEHLELGLDQLIQRLRNAEYRSELLNWMQTAPNSKVAQIGWAAIQISGTASGRFKHLEGENLQGAAANLGISEVDLVAQLIEEDGGQTSIVLHQLSEQDVRQVFEHPLHMVGSDGLPRPGTKLHPRAFGTFPRVLGHLSRDSGWFSLHDAVRRMTSVAAARFGLRDRGQIQIGMVADLVLFEESVKDNATYQEPTLLSSGVTDVWVAGTPALTDGRVTGLLPGRLLK